MEMKQTAVEWLIEQMNNIKGSSISMNGRVQFIEKELNNLLEQAKAMEKEQIIQFATEYSNHILNDGLLTPTEFFKQNFKLK